MNQTTRLTRARSASIRYRIRPADPHAHVFELEVIVDEPDPQGQTFSLPAWIPGSYMIREFARNIIRIEASGRTGRVRLQKFDKHSWRAAPCDGALTLRYRVYAWDLSVRGAHLDATHGFFNGTSVFLRVDGQEHRACEVLLEPPPLPDAAQWRVATTLPRAGARAHAFGLYRAADYDELIDHPVEMGCFTLETFEVAGVPHDIAITGQHDTDTERLAKDLQRVCTLQARLFEPRGSRPPFERYLFQVMAVGEGYGGLEHRSSTALITQRNDLPWPGMKGVSEGYRRFLGLCSHEYFHAWHVKRIKPKGFVHHELQRESYSRLLWLFEGFTSYYDDLMLLRSGVIDTRAYLEALGSTVSSVMRGPGRLEQSLAESSFDAWIKYYRQDENSANAVVSYYAKGALVALALDLSIRVRTKGEYSLDDVMRLLWQRFGRGFFGPDGRIASDADGLDEQQFPSLVRQACGLDLAAQIRAWTEGTSELPLARLLGSAGVSLALEPADDGAARLGIKLSETAGRTRIATVYSRSTAQAAGLSAGDELVAVDGLRADARVLKNLIARRGPDTRLSILVFRRDELRQFEVQVGRAAATEARLRLQEKPSAAAASLRKNWLGAH